MNSLKERAKTVLDLADGVQVYVATPENYDESCSKYASLNHLKWLKDVIKIIESMNPIIEKDLCEAVKSLAVEQGTKLVEIAQAIRGALCGKLVSPSVFEIIEILGKDESVIKRRFFKILKLILFGISWLSIKKSIA